MDISIFLARVMGISMILLYGSVLKNMRLYSSFEKSISEHPILLIISGFWGVVLGLLIIQGHNIWAFDWRVIITLLGWVLLISGAFRLIFPELALKLSEKAMRLPAIAMNSICIFLCLIGLFLTYKGFVS